MSNPSAPNFQADNPRRLKAFEATSSSLDFIQSTHSPFLLEMANKIGSLLFLNKKDLSILDFPKLEKLLIKNSRKVADEYEFSSKATRNLTMIKLSPCEKFLAIVSPTHIFVISLADFLLDEQPQPYANFEISNPQNEYKSIEWPCRTDIFIENPYFLSLDSKGNLAIHILNSGQIFYIEEDTFVCGTFSLDGKYILAINSQQELAIIDVFTLKIIRKKTIQNFDNDTTAPSYLTQIEKGVILIGSLVKPASNVNNHGVPTIDLLHCDIDTESSIIVYRSIQMPYPSTCVEFCAPVFKTIHLTESNLLFLGHSEANYLYALDLKNGEAGPQRLDLGDHMVRGFSVLELKLAHEEGRAISDQNDPIAHLPNLPRVLALDSSGELHQFRFSTSRLLPGDFPLPSEPMKLGEFRDLQIQPAAYIKHLFNEPSLFTIIDEEEEEEENILSTKNNQRSSSPEQFISPERKNPQKKSESPSLNNEQTREDQAALWRRQQFETPSFEASPNNIGASKGNNLLSGFKVGPTETLKATPSVTDLKSREPSVIETAISKEREERMKEFEKRIIRKKDIFQGNPTEGYQNHIKCLLEDAKEVIEASKKIKADIAQRNLDSLQRIIRTLNKGNSYCETALDEAQETFNQKNTETSSQSQSTPKEEQKLKNLIESYQQRLSLISKNLAPLDLFVENNQMILSIAPTTEVRRIECSSSTQKKSTTTEKSKPSQSLGRKGLVSSFQMSLKEKKQPDAKKEPTSQSQPLFNDEHEEMMEQKNQRVYERQERILKTLNLLNYLLDQKTTVIDGLQQSLEIIRKNSGADKTSKHNRGIYYDDSSDEENKVPLINRKQKFQTVPANPFEITLQQPNKFTGSQHRDQFLKDLLTHLSTRNSKHEMVLLKSYSTSMAKTDPSLYKFVDHLHLDEECAASKKTINQGLSDILTKAREKKREEERIAEQKRKEEEERRKKEEEERRRKAEEEERKRKEAEEKKRQEEAKKKAEEEAAKKKAAEEARKKAEEEAAKKKAAEQAAAASAGANTDATAGSAAPAQGQAQQGGQTNEHIEKYMKNNLEMSSTEIGALQKLKSKLGGITEQMKQNNINPASAIFILAIQNLPPAWDTEKFKALLTSSQKKFDAVKVAATSDNKKYAQIKVTGFDDAQKYVLLDGQSLEGQTLDVQIKLSEKTAPGGPAPVQGQGQQQQQQTQVNPTPQKTAMGGIGGMGGGMGGLNLGGNKGMQQQQTGGGNMFQTGGQTQNTQATGGVAFGQTGGMGMGGMGMGNKPTGVAFGQTGGMGGMGGGTGGATFGKPAFGAIGGGQAGGLGGRPAFGQTGGMMGQGQSQGQGMKTGGGFGASTGNAGGGGFMGFQGAVQQNKPAGGVSFGTSGGGTGGFGGSSSMFGAARK